MISANSKRIKETIETIAKFSEIEEGVERLSYSKEYKEAQEYLIRKMKDLDMKVRLDGVGNLFGVIEGSKKLPKLVSGSHLDSVRNAGAYDGVAGIVTALEVAYMLKENNIMLNHPYEVLATIGEEGTRFNQTLLGSQFMCGIHSNDKLDSFVGYDGKTLRETIKEYGLDADLAKTKVKDNDIELIVELHGEQGPILENENNTIGIVDTIAGISWFEVTITGLSNHAGTVPMNMRSDAAIESYKTILLIDDYVKRKYTNKATITFGRLNVSPNSPNCIPGEVKFTIDIRSGDEATIEDIEQKIKETISSIDSKYKTVIKQLNKKSPTKLNEMIKKVIESCCGELNLSCQHINSGAGHDSMIFAKKFKTGMIFVPNKDGISHNPKEFIKNEDLVAGANLLFKVICELDKEK